VIVHRLLWQSVRREKRLPVRVDELFAGAPCTPHMRDLSARDQCTRCASVPNI
jgi:hypothetical protein